jgi:RNA polymerase sigma-70 factor, ECF subfamily
MAKAQHWRSRPIHLLFNEGYWSSAAEAPIRADLCRLALGLSRSLLETYPEEPEAAGLLALLLLHDARRDARLDSGGEPVPLPEQDRAKWDRDTIHVATQMLEAALAAGRPGPMQVEAAIAAVHCRAPTASETDWAEIASLYVVLEQSRPVPAVRVNRAFALGMAKGPNEGLRLLDCVDIDSTAYPYVHLVRGTLLADAGQVAAAAAALGEAARLSRNVHERRQIEERIARLPSSSHL